MFTVSLSDLIFRLQSHNYEERYRTVEGELRKLVAMRGKADCSKYMNRLRMNIGRGGS